MNEKFNTNAKVKKFTNKAGRGVRLIVIGPLVDPDQFLSDFIALMGINNIDTGDIVDGPRKIAAFSLYLIGSAYTWFQNLTEIHRK